MNREKSGFINIEELIAQVSLEQAVSYYGITMPEIRHIGTEVRTRAFSPADVTRRQGTERWPSNLTTR